MCYRKWYGRSIGIPIVTYRMCCIRLDVAPSNPIVDNPITHMQQTIDQSRLTVFASHTFVQYIETAHFLQRSRYEEAAVLDFESALSALDDGFTVPGFKQCQQYCICSFRQHRNSS